MHWKKNGKHTVVRWPSHERESFHAFLSHLRYTCFQVIYFVTNIIVRSFRSSLVARQEIALNAIEYSQWTVNTNTATAQIRCGRTGTQLPFVLITKYRMQKRYFTKNSIQNAIESKKNIILFGFRMDQLINRMECFPSSHWVWALGEFHRIYFIIGVAWLDHH